LVSSRKLSSDEVDALIEGLQSDGDETNNSSLSNQDNVRPFKFGTDDLTLLGDYYALRMINERFARFARAVFLPMLRIQPRISSFPPEVKTFDEYTSGIESFMSLTASRIEELRGNMMLVMDPVFISILTCNAISGESSCNANDVCSWCDAAAVKPACHSIENAKRLPPAVF
jgi:flagellar motor switch protein FliM